MRRRISAGLAALLLLAAVAPATAAVDDGVGSGDTDVTVSASYEDPPGDTIGWENGYWHDEPIDVDQSDGLSDAELEAYVARSMARVEYVRRTEFERTVPVEVISRSEFQQRGENASTNTAFGAWNNQVWEALFIVGEDRDVQSELQNAVGSSTMGFYAPGDDRIRIVTDTPDRPTIDNGTLIHELVHALQDQNGALGEQLGADRTQDGDLAADGVIEGEANYIERRYSSRCGVEWDCVGAPESRGGGDGDPPNLGILLTLLQPYSDGPVYVDWLRQRGGWDAVDAKFANPPLSTEQVIHRTDEKPVPIAFEDRARNGWEPFPQQGDNGSDTVGEASMYVMFWYQARTAGADTVAPGSVGRTTDPLDMYNYDAPPSAGWGNDRLFPYREASGEEVRYGYVWMTEWDTRRDASQFVAAHRAILDAHDATRRGENTYVIPDGAYADAFRIDRTGTRVTVVNGPTVAALADIRPTGAAEDGAPSGAAEANGGATARRARDPGVSTAFVAVATTVLAVVTLVLVFGRRRVQ